MDNNITLKKELFNDCLVYAKFEVMQTNNDKHDEEVIQILKLGLVSYHDIKIYTGIVNDNRITYIEISEDD